MKKEGRLYWSSVLLHTCWSWS